MDDEMNMYDTDGFEPEVKGDNDKTVAVTHKGVITELDINGKKFDVVNPEYVKELKHTISAMDMRIQRMDRIIRNLLQRNTLQDRYIKDLRSQLDGKIDRE